LPSSSARARASPTSRAGRRLDAELLSAYSQLAPTGTKLEAAAVQRVFPALESAALG